MKNKTKRTLSFILAMCLIVSVLPFGALAEDPVISYTYDFSGWTSGQSLTVGAEAADGSGSWEYVAGYKANLKGEPDLVRWKAQSAEEGVTFIAFQLNDIPYGTYTMDFDFYTQSGGGEADIYILPAASLPSTTDAIHTLLDTMTAAGTVGNYKSGAVLSPATIDSVTFSGSADGSYVIVFRSTTNVAGSAINTTTINLRSISLTPNLTAVSPAAIDFSGWTSG